VRYRNTEDPRHGLKIRVEALETTMKRSSLILYLACVNGKRRGRSELNPDLSNWQNEG
jgi:hypothetical protein